MNFSERIFVLNNINLTPNASLTEAFSVAEGKLRKCGVSTLGKRLEIFRKSIDARKKNDIRLIVSVSVCGAFSEGECKRLLREGLSEIILEHPSFVKGSEALTERPVVVGSGPAGLFAALLLAEAGFKPIVLERGAPVDERTEAVKAFTKTRRLDTDTNIQFGAGGAGTFSDGKLITRITDSLSAYILKRLTEFGAPEEILYLAKPHVGTDVLSGVVKKVLERIETLGGTVHYRTTFLSAVTDARGRVHTVKTSRGELAAGALILAIGHSARDTYLELSRCGHVLEPKPFSVGMRIEHLTEDIDRAMYGDFAGTESLGHAEYALSHNTKVRGVYTFCMCPGGEVVAATSEHGGTVTNGMSHHARNGRNSNSAVVCSVFKEDYGSDPLAAIEFQRKIERAAFVAGGSDYTAPCITVGDFLSDKCQREPGRIKPTYMDGGVKLASPYEYLPSFVADGIKDALLAFDRKIAGFAAEDAVLTGAETRTSAPIRILRDRDSRIAVGYDNIYPSGEGAGYAGGITSAAIDGARTAISVISRYKPTYG